MIGLRFRPPCRSPRAQSERLSALADGDDSDRALVDHVRGCEVCGRVLDELKAQRAALAALGDAPGAAPTDVGLHRILVTLAAEKRAQRLPRWAVLAGATAIALIVGGVTVRQLLARQHRRMTDEQIMAGADAAYRRAEREYTEAVSLLRERLQSQLEVAPDPELERGAKVLAAAREQAAALASRGEPDPERQALLRQAFRAEIRYYEDALLRGPRTGAVEGMP